MPQKLLTLGKGPKWFKLRFIIFREWVFHEGEKMWSIDACPSSYYLTFSLVFFLLNISIFLCLSMFSFLSSTFCFLASPFTIHGYPLLYYLSLWNLPTVFGFLWASLQDYPLTCRLSSHYFCPECVGCTTPHFQTKLLVLFLTFLCFCFTSIDKD